MKVKKYYGQHFLTDEEIAKQIVESLDSGQPVVEVGPGKGILTKYLTERFEEIKICEIDQDMVAYLNKQYPNLQDNIIQGDFLDLDLSNIGFNSFAVIGNFPYNLSSQIIFKILDTREIVPTVVGMFQKEVAKRIASDPGSKEYGVISVLVQAHYDVEYLFEVNPEHFDPAPKVTSAVIRLIRHNRSLDCDPVKFRQVVKTAFNQRRKQLVNALSSLIAKDKIPEQYRNKRAENLSIADFSNLSKLF